MAILRWCYTDPVRIDLSPFDGVRAIKHKKLNGILWDTIFLFNDQVQPSLREAGPGEDPDPSDPWYTITVG